MSAEPRTTVSKEELAHSQMVWKGFMELVKWSGVAIAVLLALMAIFLTH